MVKEEKKPSRRLPPENFIDHRTIERADDGDRSAIKTLCWLAAGHVQAMSSCLAIQYDDLTPFLVDALEKIAKGEDPNTAFGWKRGRGRRPENTSLRDWGIRMDVQQRMLEKGEDKTTACSSVTRSAGVGGDVDLEESRVMEICKGLDTETDLEAEFQSLDLS